MALSIQELRDELDMLIQQDPANADKKACFAYNYGDRVQTQVVGYVDDVREGKVIRSEYHRQDKVLDQDDAEYDDEDSEATDVIILD